MRVKDGKYIWATCREEAEAEEVEDGGRRWLASIAHRPCSIAPPSPLDRQTASGQMSPPNPVHVLQPRQNTVFSLLYPELGLLHGLGLAGLC
jgi:hypothetical protein